MSARTVPKTTPSERTRYRELAREYARECAAVEPEHARSERVRYREARAFEVVRLRLHRAPQGSEAAHVDFMTHDRWSAWWRGLPDYDGGPRRSPSGVRLRETEVSDLRGSTLVPSGRAWVVDDDARGRAVLMQHLAGLVRAGALMERCEVIRVDDRTDPYGPPSEGGRGWCPLLAAVQP